MFIKRLLFILVFCASLSKLYAQTEVKNVAISWNQNNLNATDESTWRFYNCEYVKLGSLVLPTYFNHFQVPTEGYEAQPINLQYEEVEATSTLKLEISNTKIPLYKSYVTHEAGKTYLNVEIFPYRINALSGDLERLKEFDLQIKKVQQSNDSRSLFKKGEFAANSVLAVGDWYKLKIPSEGVYRLTVADLKAMNIDPSSIDVSSFQLMGTEGGLVPEVIAAPRTDDLKELAIQVLDANNNNRLDGNDEIRFYAEGPHVWRFDNSLGQYIHENNFYDNFNYVYLTHSQKTGKRVSSMASGQGESFEGSISGYHQLILHETDLHNFIASGREWFGESFGKQNQRTFSHTVGNVRLNDTAFLRQRFGGRSVKGQSSYSININGSPWHSSTIYAVGGDYDQNFMDHPSLVSKTFEVKSNKIDLLYSFNPGPPLADAWLDYYELSVPVELQLGNGQQYIYSKEAAGYDKVRYTMSGNFELWNVTDYFNPFAQQTFEEAGKKMAVVQSNKLRLRFAAFDGSTLKKPEYLGKVVNQNLHSITAVDYIIVTHPEFESQAKRLADFHQNQNGYNVAVVTTTAIYNEFGGGQKDAGAIRDFIRMVYERGLNSAKPLRFALMFGDGSYDFKDRIDKNTHFIPTFQSRNSYDPSYSYASDDFYAILDENEGYFDVNLAKEGLDIGIGRIPCRSVGQAKIMVDKVINYHQPTSFGEWRNRLTFVADDEDRNQHFDDTELVTAYIDNQNPVYNVDKIYLDAYVQQSFGSGEKYPDVNAAIDRNFDRGHFVLNYLGHGGPSGLAHERVITRDQIRNWSNGNKLPVIITATCELTRYDDPSQDSPGELALFDDDGGAIALITTTRLVYINLNRNLNDKVLDQNMFDLSGGGKTLGEIITYAKNRTQRDVNQRNFSMIGDPGMVLAYPKLQVRTIAINDSIIGVQPLDTFKAFAKMKVAGEVLLPNGNLAANFNGLIYPTIYDKYLTYSTLQNDPTSFERTYKMQNSVIYRGKVSVINGKFSYQFVVPKDISYKYGKGKIVYYTEDGVIDGNGYDSNITVGGSSSDVAQDSIGPEIELYMDDFSFVFGGITRTKPLLLCKVFDENGINTVGNGIGRDITAILDEGTEHEKILVLNDYYQSTLDSYQEGEIRFNMEALEPGRHTLKIRVWDVYNNATEDYTEFVVASDEDLSLGHVLNYPNPFTTHTVFHFDHNKEGQNIEVMIQVMNISGKVVQTFHHASVSASGHFDQIEWNGRDSYGDQLARGVYIYKITVKSEDGTAAEAMEKLVLLK